MLRLAAALTVLLPLAARADPVQVHYATYAAGLNVMALDAGLDLSPQRYRLSIAYEITGTLSMFFSSRIRSQVEGAFVAGRARPTRVFSAGSSRGEPRVVQIDYPAGQPVIRQMQPASDAEREPVPPELQRGTVDTLSAMAELIRQVNQTGRCEGTVRTFDGHRLAELRAWTVGMEELPRTRLSSYAGPALHCGFEGKQLGGFVRDEDRERLREPHRGGAWFASVGPGQPVIPVRITFHTRWFGDATTLIAPPG